MVNFFDLMQIISVIRNIFVELLVFISNKSPKSISWFTKEKKKDRIGPGIDFFL